MSTWRRKSYPVEVEWMGDTPSAKYKVAAWVIDREGKAWVVDGYSDQGPDILHLVDKDGNDVPVLTGHWVVYHEGVGFKVMDGDEFHREYEATLDD